MAAAIHSLDQWRLIHCKKLVIHERWSSVRVVHLTNQQPKASLRLDFNQAGIGSAILDNNLFGQDALLPSSLLFPSQLIGSCFLRGKSIAPEQISFYGLAYLPSIDIPQKNFEIRERKVAFDRALKGFRCKLGLQRDKNAPVHPATECLNNRWLRSLLCVTDEHEGSHGQRERPDE